MTADRHLKQLTAIGLGPHTPRLSHVHVVLTSKAKGHIDCCKRKPYDDTKHDCCDP